MESILKHFKDYYVRYILTIIILFFILFQVNWLIRDNVPIRWDESWNLLVSNYYYNSFIGHEELSYDEMRNLYSYFGYGSYYPPFFKFSSIPLYLIFGFSPDIATMTNMIFYIVLILSVFFITKRIKNSNAALFACFLVSTVPYLIGLSRFYLLDFSFISMNVLGIAIFMNSENFKSRKYSIIFGIVFGLGMLTRINYFLILGPTILFMVFLHSLKSKLGKEQIKNLILSSIIAFFIFFQWFFRHSIGVLRYLRNQATLDWSVIEDGNPVWNSFDGIAYYIKFSYIVFSKFYFVLFLLSLLIISFYLYKNKKKLIEEKNVIILGLLFFVIFSWIVFTYLGNKDLRFISPIYPVMGIITAIGIYTLDFDKKIIGILIISIIIFGLISLNSATNQYLRDPLNQDWKIENILFLINKDAENNSLFVATVGIDSDLEYFNQVNFQMYAYSKNIKNLKINTKRDDDYDYLIIRGENSDGGYRILEDFKLPDGSTAKIYKKIN